MAEPGGDPASQPGVQVFLIEGHLGCHTDPPGFDIANEKELTFGHNNPLTAG